MGAFALNTTKEHLVKCSFLGKYKIEVEQPQGRNIFQILILAFAFIKEIITKQRYLVILCNTKSLQPKANGGNHILANTQSNHSFRTIEVISSHNKIIPLLQPKRLTRERLMPRKRILFYFTNAHILSSVIGKKERTLLL